MKIRYWIACFLLLISMGLRGVELPLFLDFKKPLPPEIRLPSSATLQDGYLDLNGVKGGVHSVKLPVDITIPFQLKFRVREIDSLPKDSHWGVPNSVKESPWLFHKFVFG